MTPQEQFDSGRQLIELALTEQPGFFPMNLFRLAYEQGKKAKRCGWARVSPFVDDDELRNPYWFAGYDGLTFILPEPKTDA